jgi:hypothetical protein
MTKANNPNRKGQHMTDIGTDLRDHDTGTDAFRAEVQRSRTANADKQADLMVSVFGPGRLTEPDPEDPQNWFRKRPILPDVKGAPGSTIRRIQEALDDS